MAKIRVCILVRNELKRDPRVLRQVKWLAEAGNYDITVIGFGDPGFALNGATRTIAFRPKPKSLGGKIGYVLRLFTCNFFPGQAERVYWSQPVVQALWAAAYGEYDIIHANDWDTLPVAFRLAQNHPGCRVIYDSHELAVAEFDGEIWFSLFHKTYRRGIEERYIRRADHVITVSPLIAERLSEMYDIPRPEVIMNCPDWEPIEATEVDPANIKLCCHGKYGPDRGVEELIQAMGMLGLTYTLHLYLIFANDQAKQSLSELAEKIAPGRVFFHQPVPTADIVRTINQYDIGVYVLKPTNFNNQAAVPNKFFEFMMAGLCLCIGPTKQMRSFLEDAGCGVVAGGFDASGISESVKGLEPSDIMQYKDRALAVAKDYSSQTEGRKMIALYFLEKIKK